MYEVYDPYVLVFILFPTLCNPLKYVINFYHLIIINYACFAWLLYSPNGFSKYFVTEDVVRNIETCLINLKNGVVFLKGTICFLLSRPFGMKCPVTPNGSNFREKEAYQQ